MENNKKEQVKKDQPKKDTPQVKNEQVKKKPEQIKKEVKTTEMVVLCKTSYHYWRNWLKEILKDTGAKFNKDEKGWKGSISITKTDIDKAKKLLTDYKTKNPETKELWW